jgi:uncharacterized membrane protein YhaH (DUF805 family)
MSESQIPIEKDYSWKKEQEQILKKWADKSLCFKMMHERSYKKYWCLNAWFNIPVIIISTITGTGNFASGSFGSGSGYITFIIGGFNLFAGILATIATYTGVAQKLEAHRFSSVAWDKFSRKLQIELSKSRTDRVKAKDFIKQSAEEYDRLIEMSPILPNDIIRWFSNMIETGEFDEELGECSTFCFECFCFPCGCSFCKLPCCQGIKRHHDEEIKKEWSLIELPEVIGRIKPTGIAEEPEPKTPPPLVIIKKSIETIQETKSEDNPYDVYNLSFSDNSDDKK